MLAHRLGKGLAGKTIWLIGGGVVGRTLWSADFDFSFRGKFRGNPTGTTTKVKFNGGGHECSPPMVDICLAGVANARVANPEEYMAADAAVRRLADRRIPFA
jgi:hypothetical protein